MPWQDWLADRQGAVQALNVLSHVDFQITQVVDANVGIHVRIPKYAPQDMQADQAAAPFAGPAHSPLL